MEGSSNRGEAASADATVVRPVLQRSAMIGPVTYASCPKCGHAPLPHDQALPAACAACGVVLAKTTWDGRAATLAVFAIWMLWIWSDMDIRSDNSS
jgi:ribosomal protein S27E